MIIYTCEYCGKEFKPKDSHPKRPHPYCSKKCAGVATKDARCQPRKDLTGQRFGKLIPIRRTSREGHNDAWICKCDCGNEIIRTTQQLNNRKDTMQSCGCFNKEFPGSRVNMIGQRVGKLTIVAKHSEGNGNVIWLCQCECGKQVTRKTNYLRYNRRQIQSCGCSKHEYHFLDWAVGVFSRYGPNWKQQRAAARARDHYTCQECGKNENGKVFDVHHIRPFKDFDSWQEANRLENLITLCQKCHLKQNPR